MTSWWRAAPMLLGRDAGGPVCADHRREMIAAYEGALPVAGVAELEPPVAA